MNKDSFLSASSTFLHKNKHFSTRYIKKKTKKAAATDRDLVEKRQLNTSLPSTLGRLYINYKIASTTQQAALRSNKHRTLLLKNCYPLWNIMKIGFYHTTRHARLRAHTPTHFAHFISQRHLYQSRNVHNNTPLTYAFPL